MKVTVTDECTKREQERLVRFFQDALDWTEGDDFEVQRHAFKNQSQNSGRDELVNCSDCSSPFTFSVGEQHFFAQNNLQPPKRCPECRKKRKAEKNRDGGNRRAFANRR